MKDIFAFGGNLLLMVGTLAWIWLLVVLVFCL